MKGLILALIAIGVSAENKRLKEVFSWKTVEYQFPKSADREAAIKSKIFIPENNLPLGLDVWRDKLFVTVPRWKSGVVSSLNYIDISDIDTFIDFGEVDEEPTPVIEVEDGEEELDNVNEESNDEDEGLVDGVTDLIGGEDGVLEGVGDLLGGVVGDGENEGLLGGVGDAVAGEDGLLGGVGDAVAGEDGLLGGVGDAVAGEEGLLGGVGDAVAGEDGLLGGVGDAVAGEDGLLGGVGDAVAGEDGLLGGVGDAVAGEDGLLGGVGDAVAGEDGLLGGVGDMVGGEDGVLDTVTGVTDPLLGADDDEAGAVGEVLDAVGDAPDLVGGGGLVDGVEEVLPGSGSDESPLDTVSDAVAPVAEISDAATEPVDEVLNNDDEMDDENDDKPPEEGQGPEDELVPEGNVEEPQEDEDPDANEVEATVDEGDEDLLGEGTEADPLDENPTESSAVTQDVTEIPDSEEDIGSGESGDDSEESEEETQEDQEAGNKTRFLIRSLPNSTIRSLGSKKYGKIDEKSKENCPENIKECQLRSRKSISKEARTKKTAIQEHNTEASEKIHISKDKRTSKLRKGEQKSKTSKTTKKKVKISTENKNEGSQGNVIEKPRKNSESKHGTSSKIKKKKETSKKKGDSNKWKNSKSNIVKDSKSKENNKENGVSTNNKTCRDSDINPCGKPVPEPVFVDVFIESPKPSKTELYGKPKKDKKKKKVKKEKKKNCQKKCKKPKNECVKPAKVSATSPALIPYPNIEANTLEKNSKDNKITSVFRVRVDPCDRLWVMDSGIADILGDTIVYSNPQILVYNLLNDKLLRKFELKSEHVQEHSFFANIVVDVTKEKCAEAFAYVPDLGSYAIVVYDMKNDKAWRIKHNYFHFNPLEGNYHVGGVNFQWTDGIFSLALTRPNPDGSRTAFFHALSSFSEFKVNTFVLQSENEGKSSNYSAYSLVGNKGPDSQTSASFIHEPTGVMFYTQVNKDAVYCWNTDKPFEPDNLQEVASDPETMIFPNDLKVDYKNNLWVLTDKLPVFVNKGLGDKEVNYRIFVSPVSEAIKNTNCAP